MSKSSKKYKYVKKITPSSASPSPQQPSTPISKESFIDTFFNINKTETELLNYIKQIPNIQEYTNLRDKEGNTTLIFASAKGYLDLVKFLVEKGKSNVNDKNNEGITALMAACDKENLDIVKYLVAEGGSNINDKTIDGITALIVACFKGNLNIIKYLVAKGANINDKTNNGDTALLFSCEKGNLDIVKYLITEGGANINDKNNNGDTALIIASNKGYLDIVKFLITEGGANINDKNKYNQTALIKASENDYFDIIKYLVTEGGANINDKDNNGESALDIAQENNNIPIVNYLKSKLNIEVEIDKSFIKTFFNPIDDIIIKKITENILNNLNEIDNYSINELNKVDSTNQNIIFYLLYHLIIVDNTLQAKVINIFRMLKSKGVVFDLYNSKEYTPLIIAIVGGNEFVTLVQVLIKEIKVDVNYKESSIAYIVSLSVYYTDENRKIVLKLFLDNGAIISIQYAICNNNIKTKVLIDLIKLMIENKVINTQNDKGQTILHHILLNNCSNIDGLIFNMLIRNTNLNIQDKSGNSIWSLLSNLRTRNELIEEIKKSIPKYNTDIVTINSNLNNQDKCVNKINDAYLTYTELYDTYCFTKQDLANIIKFPINIYTGNIVDKNFYESLFPKDKLNQYVNDYYNMQLLNMKTIKAKKFKLMLSKLTTDWIIIYTSGTYMINHDYFIIPHSVRTQLLYFRNLQYNHLYRGISFGLHNINYLKNFRDGLKDNLSTREIINNTNKFLSTTTDISVAKDFSNNNFIGIVGEIVNVKPESIIVDLSYIANEQNYDAEDTTFNCSVCGYEKEVILSAGEYTFKVLPEYKLEIIEQSIDILTEIDSILNKFDHKVFYKKYVIFGNNGKNNNILDFISHKRIKSVLEVHCNLNQEEIIITNTDYQKLIDKLNNLL